MLTRRDRERTDLEHQGARLAGKVTIITGAASGIGLASARLFAAEGAKVVVADRDERGRDVAEEIGAAFYRVDVARAADVQAMVAFTEELYGQVNVLFSNAGVTFAGSLEETSEEEFDELIAVNLKGALLCIQAAIPAMRRAKGGVILTTASAAGLAPRSGLAAYAATKAGVVMLTKSVALEYAKDGIRAVAICPGIIETPMSQKMESLYEDQATARRQVQQLYPIGRYGKPEEVAQAALFLASSDASYVTGIAFAVDGGRSLH